MRGTSGDSIPDRAAPGGPGPPAPPHLPLTAPRGRSHNPGKDPAPFRPRPSALRRPRRKTARLGAVPRMTRAAALLAPALLVAPPARAEEPHLEFVRGLQARGMAALAADYLQ